MRYCILISFLFLLTETFFVNSFVISPISNLKLKSPIVQQMAKAKISDAAAKGYWEGEWICADCGYIYDRDVDGGGLYFEELKRGFICPQCSAPRKRYAKKVGDQWGVTRDGGDLPIYATTFVGLAVTAWFALVYVPTL